MKLLLIEDHPFVRAGLRSMIRQPYPECDIIEADNAEQGLFLALNDPVDLILLDLCLPAVEGGKESFTQGLGILEALQISPGAPPIVVMSGMTREAPAILARQRGAAAVVLKGAAPAILWEAMEQCLLGKELIPADRTKTPEAPADQIEASITSDELGISPRMFDVLRLALQGHPSKKIAQILGINGTNVRHYLSRLYEKFGVANLNGLQAHFAISGRLSSIIS